MAPREGFEPPREISHRLSRPALYRAKRPRLHKKRDQPNYTWADHF